MVNCWRCGQGVERPGATYCDRCGAQLAGQTSQYMEGEQRLFDSRVALLFYVIGASAILLGIGWWVMWAAFTADVGGVGILGALGGVGGLVVGGFFIWLGYSIDRKGKA
ncbi:MAG: hypothetical protein MUE65_06830 [Methanomassiliicoccales archaeon]|nr:hypothetical protein [Methanomassiliicoccales archaeon]